MLTADRGLPLDSLDMLSVGIPLAACGVCLDDPTTYEIFPNLILLLRLFGVTVETDADTVDIPNGLYSVAASLSEALLRQSDPRWQDVAWWVGWGFGVTGNTLVDTTDEDLSEVPPLAWTDEDITFARDLIAEADEMMTAAQRGAAWIIETPAAQTMLKCLVTRTRQGWQQWKQRQTRTHRPQRRKEKHYVPHLRLDELIGAGGTE